MHTDVSHTQIGAVIAQDNQPIAFYSRKLNLAQTHYTTTERKLPAIVEPKTKKQLCHLIGIVNYYRNMSICRSELLAPLTKLTSKDAKFQWTDVETKAFKAMKKALSRDTLLAYPDFNKEFEIYTDASHCNRQQIKI